MKAAFKRYSPLLLLAAAYLATSLLSRLLIWVAFGRAADVPAAHLPWLLGIGLVNDMVESLYLLAPLALYLLLLPDRWFAGRLNQALLAMGTWVTLFGMMYLGWVEYFFFDEFDARFNLVAVDYLMYPHEVFVNIWESYPVPLALVVSAVLASLAYRLVWPSMRNAHAQTTSFASRAKPFALHAAALAAAISSFSTQSLGYSDNRVENELAANGLSSLFQAFHSNELDFQQLYRTGDASAMQTLMRRDLATDGAPAAESGSISRHFPAHGPAYGRLNVVVIVEESFGCEHVDACGADLGLTPAFDALSRQGLFFSQTYATGTRTVRGLEALSASLAPIPSESVLKRPGYEQIATWGEIMQAQGYRNSFLYGGFCQFDNMNHFFAAHGFRISDRSDIKEARFANIWGVSDQDLFTHSLAYFDREHASGKPFFAFIMSTSNHKPYTFPAGVAQAPAKGGGRAAGIRYADHALGEFLAQAASHAWYRDTLFVIVADHGARVYGKQRIPMYSYHIPLLILAPGRIEPQVLDTPASQVDVAPTVMSLLGLDFSAPFIGRDLLAPSSRPVTLLFNHNHDVALLRDSHMAVLGLKNSADVYDYQLGSRAIGQRVDDPQLLQLATAYYQTTFNLFKQGRLR
jgi:phosphoglycerol transferase MdoB-like AlkP superfamily enzyme